MSKSCFFIGLPCRFQKDIYVYPPKVSEVVGNPTYGLFVKVLTLSQEDIEDEYTEKNKDNAKPPEGFPTPLEFLLVNSYHNKEYEKLAKEAFKFFLKQTATFLYEQKTIVLGDLESLKKIESLDDLMIINEDNFFDLQNLIRESIGDKPIEKPDPNMHPRLRVMKAKARYRDRMKAKQAAEKGTGITTFTTLASICCMGLGITPLNIGEMSYVATQTIMSYYQDKEKYDVDIRSLLAGADSKKIKPKYWIKNLEE